MICPRPAAAALFVAALCSLLSGCSEAPSFPNAEPSSTTPQPEITGGILRGHAHGGQQPIVGARIYLLAAGTTGYGSASTSLLTSTSYPSYPAQQDASKRYYVTTDTGGNFQIVDTCTPGQQIYLASVGGNPGGGANTAANEIAILGQCPASGNFDSTLTGVYVSEISTVAAAYATASYAVDTFDIGGPSTTALQQTGIANAFANAASLFDIENINDLARVATPGGNGTVPQAKIHTLANILAACINSVGPSSPSCVTLFANAKTGGLTGTAPLDVATAAINMAHNPSAGLSALYGLQVPSAPFSPQLGLVPNDFTLSLTFPGAALGVNPSLAIDGGGNVWTLSAGGSAVSKLSPTGAVLSGSTGYAVGSSFLGARGLALDPSNNVWVLGQATGNELLLGNLVTFPTPAFAELNSTGLYQKTLTETPLLVTHPPTPTTNLAIDGSGNFYYSTVRTGLLTASSTCCTEKYTLASGTFTDLDPGNALPGTNFVAISNTGVWATGSASSLSQISPSGNHAVSGGGLSTATGVALDSAGNAWVVNTGNSSVSKFTSAGTPVTSTGYTGGFSAPKAIAADGLGNLWVTNSSGSLNLSELSNAGVAIGTGYAASGVSNAGAVAVDSSGDIWMASATSATLTEFIGIAAPVITPTSVAVGAGALGMRP